MMKTSKLTILALTAAALTATSALAGGFHPVADADILAVAPYGGQASASAGNGDFTTIADADLGDVGRSEIREARGSGSYETAFHAVADVDNLDQSVSCPMDAGSTP